MNLVKYLGWEKCSFSDYRKIALTFGFNGETSPYYIEFALNHGAKLDFYLFRTKNKIRGGVCIDNGWLCNDRKNSRNQLSNLPIPSCAIIPPFESGVTCIIPFKSKSLLLNHNVTILNSSFHTFSKREIAICKEISAFSKKTIYTREREVKRFVNDGGYFKNISELTASELYDHYHSLYSKRRSTAFYESPLLRKFFSEFKDNFVGHVAFFNNSPASIQLNLSTKSNFDLFIDFINIGYDTDIKNHSLGNIIMWKNLNYYSEMTNKNLTYSYGMMSGDYKKRWCIPVKTGRLIFI